MNIFDFSENLQKSLKSDVSDTNGRRESDFQVEFSTNDTVKTDFRSTVTHFMTFLMIFQFFVQNYWFLLGIAKQGRKRPQSECHFFVKCAPLPRETK